MREFISKYGILLLLVSVFAVHVSGGYRAFHGFGKPQEADSTLRAKADSLPAPADSTTGQAAADTAERILTARDTLKAPDSLRTLNPFLFKYYAAVKDSLTHAEVRDSLRAAGDSLDWPRLDSLYYADSALAARARFEAWYASLDKKEKKRYDKEQEINAKIRQMDSVMARKDSIRAHKDSVFNAKPRILSTAYLPDSLQYKRIISWTHERHFQRLDPAPIDTGYNFRFNDYPFLQEDVNAVYAGTAGSAVLTHDFFLRKPTGTPSFYAPFASWTYTPETLPMYNTKTPYTELSYYGNLFSNKEKEEGDIRIFTTQNILPELNVTLEYKRYGSNGMLDNERTDNRTGVIAANWTGERWLMHAGLIHNKVEKNENGGMTDTFWIRDTTVDDTRAVPVHLTEAKNLFKKNTLFLDQSLRIPFTFLKNRKYRLEEKADAILLDSVNMMTDSVLRVHLLDSLAKRKALRDQARADADTITDVTTAFIGHSSEYSVFRKIYTDKIASTDAAGREYYGEHFYLHPTASYDSLRVMQLDNRVFLRLQPWAENAIVSRIEGGLGDRLTNWYLFRPSLYLGGKGNTKWNSVYAYAGAEGRLKQFIQWDALGEFTFAGAQAGDFRLDANAALTLRPFRRDKKSPLEIRGHFETSLEEPEYYSQHYFSNHFRWENHFDKISATKVEASVQVPRWRLGGRFGYALLANPLWFDADGLHQAGAVNVMTLALHKDFTLWKLHFDHRAVLQMSSDDKVIPLPPLSLNARYYFQFNVKRNVMQMQIGANAYYTTLWYAPGYNPATGMFQNQREEKYGNCPYVDAFVNIQWKRACVFVKVSNVNMGWPSEHPDYFSAHGLIRPARQFKFGVYWPFYVGPHKNESVSGKAGTGLGGGGGEGGGLGGGLGSALGGLKSGRR